jgi:hypothetical protein
LRERARLLVAGVPVRRPNIACILLASVALGTIPFGDPMAVGCVDFLSDRDESFAAKAS